MKWSINFILLFVTCFCYSQTKLDSAIFNKVNQYRKSQNLKPVVWDSICFKAAKKHTTYLYQKNFSIWPQSFSGHTEDTLINPSDRYKFYSNNRKFLHLAEVSLSISRNYNSNDSLLIDKISTQVVEGWKSSVKHNKILLDDFSFAGINCQYFTKSSGFRGGSNYRIVSTMVFVK